MTKRIVDFRDCQVETLQAFDGRRVLLASQGNDGRPNAMAIGWGSMGIIWKKPIFTVLVRPSRYSQGLIEQSGEFTVNVAAPGMEGAVKYCGTVSGRDFDKFAVQGLTALAASQVKTPLIKECLIHYECRVVYKSDLDPAALAQPILSETFGGSVDFHRIYYGEIVACQREM